MKCMHKAESNRQSYGGIYHVMKKEELPMTVKSSAAAGLVGLMLAGAAVTVYRSPRMRARRMARRAGMAMDAVGTMLQSMAVMTR